MKTINTITLADGKVSQLYPGYVLEYYTGGVRGWLRRLFAPLRKQLVVTEVDFDRRSITLVQETNGEVLRRLMRLALPQKKA